VSLYVINPLSDNRWDDLVARHPRASVFHERGWLEALNRTYGYQPFVLTGSPASQQLSSGLVLCRVSSWITGTRWVSLPFADHCDPMLNDLGDLPEFTKWLRAECDRQVWKYVELRLMSRGEESGTFTRDRTYLLHTLDLCPTLEEIFRSLHKDSAQRRIRRAERAGLSYEIGCAKHLVEQFYRILVMTRKRHQVPPQPRLWFRNLVECMGDKVQIRLARKNGTPIAALLTLRHRSSVVNKYVCSDARFHHLGGVPFLLWKLIEESKASGAQEIDFGRSDVDNPGLINFKDRFGTTRKSITYLRYPQAGTLKSALWWDSQTMHQLFSMVPDALLPTFGKVLYRHIG
jgi:hypothetical protein